MSFAQTAAYLREQEPLRSTPASENRNRWGAQGEQHPSGLEPPPAPQDVLSRRGDSTGERRAST